MNIVVNTQHGKYVNFLHNFVMNSVVYTQRSKYVNFLYNCYVDDPVSSGRL